jgi:hypothetical protein
MDLRSWTVLIALILVAGPAAAQDSQGPTPSASAMVVEIPSDNLYHQPGCPLVAKAGSKVKVMRLGEANRRGMKAHDCRGAAEASDDGSSRAAAANAVPVYVQDGDRRYHLEKCERLTKTPQKQPLDKAGRTHFPCPVCKPPVRQRPGK